MTLLGPGTSWSVVGKVQMQSSPIFPAVWSGRIWGPADCPCFQQWWFQDTSCQNPKEASNMISYDMISYYMISYHMIWYIVISYDILWYDIMSYDIIWYHMIWYAIIWHHMILYDIISYHIISYDVIWYDMIWCYMTWYDKVRHILWPCSGHVPKKFGG